MKFKRIPFVGFYLYVLSLVLLIVGYVISMSAFQAFSLDVDRFVLIFPIFAMWIIIVQVVMSFVDVNKPLWMGAADLLFCFLVLFAFGRVLIPFLTPIGIYFTVNMGDVATYAIAIPRCITGCVFLIASCIFFIAGNFFKIVKIKENN